jgi:hypothetical protein
MAEALDPESIISLRIMTKTINAISIIYVACPTE